jgi:hypothetical protein
MAAPIVCENSIGIHLAQCSFEAVMLGAGGPCVTGVQSKFQINTSVRSGEPTSRHHMVAGIHVRGSAGDIPGEIADEPHGDCANILDRDETPHRRSGASLVN